MSDSRKDRCRDGCHTPHIGRDMPSLRAIRPCHTRSLSDSSKADLGSFTDRTVRTSQDLSDSLAKVVPPRLEPQNRAQSPVTGQRTSGGTVPAVRAAGAERVCGMVYPGRGVYPRVYREVYTQGSTGRHIPRLSSGVNVINAVTPLFSCL